MEGAKIISTAVLFLIFATVYCWARKHRNIPKVRASQRFFEAFIDSIQDLSQGRGDAYEFLREALPKHEKAYLQFRQGLKGNARKGFDEAWRDYCCSGNGHPVPFPEQYFAAGNETVAKEKRQLAIRRIKRLLFYAKNGYPLLSFQLA